MNGGRGERDRGGMQPLHHAVGELIEKLDCVVRIGKIQIIDYKSGKGRVAIAGPKPEEGILTDWIPWVVHRASNNRKWQAPEIGEQVVILAPGGRMVNAFIMGTINQAAYPHLAANEDYEIEEYSFFENEDDETTTLGSFLEHNRRDGVRRWWIRPENGIFRWEIGSSSCIIMNRTHIQLRVGATQIVITGNDHPDGNAIKLHVDGRTSELKMTPDSIIAHVLDEGVFTIMRDKIQGAVQGSGVLKILESLVELSVLDEGVLSVRSNSISAKLESMQVRLGLFALGIKAMVHQSWLYLTNQMADIRTPGSAFTVQDTGTILQTPHFSGISSSAVSGLYDGGAPSIPFDTPAPGTPHKTVPAPDRAVGFPPSRPIE